MLMVDVVGIIVTICLVGLRYPHYVLCALIINELGRVLTTLFLHGRIESIVASGAFGSTTAEGIKSGGLTILMIFSGAIANYIVSAVAGGAAYEKTVRILDPLAAVKHPFAIVNLRLAILTFLINIWQCL